MSPDLDQLPNDSLIGKRFEEVLIEYVGEEERPIVHLLVLPSSYSPSCFSEKCEKKLLKLVQTVVTMCRRYKCQVRVETNTNGLNPVEVQLNGYVMRYTATHTSSWSEDVWGLFHEVCRELWPHVCAYVGDSEHGMSFNEEGVVTCDWKSKGEG